MGLEPEHLLPIITFTLFKNILILQIFNKFLNYQIKYICHCFIFKLYNLWHFVLLILSIRFDQKHGNIYFVCTSLTCERGFVFSFGYELVFVLPSANCSLFLSHLFAAHQLKVSCKFVTSPQKRICVRWCVLVCVPHRCATLWIRRRLHHLL